MAASSYQLTFPYETGQFPELEQNKGLNHEVAKGKSTCAHADIDIPSSLCTESFGGRSVSKEQQAVSSGRPLLVNPWYLCGLDMSSSQVCSDSSQLSSRQRPGTVTSFISTNEQAYPTSTRRHAETQKDIDCNCEYQQSCRATTALKSVGQPAATPCCFCIPQSPACP